MNAADRSHELAVRRRRRIGLGLLALLFFAPVAVSFYLYYAQGWRPGGDTSHGELITPARPLPEVSLPTPDGTRTASDFLRGKWSLIYVGRLEQGRCDEQCRRALYSIRQVRLSLNEKADRVQRVLLFSGACCEQPFFSAEHTGLLAAEIETEEGARLLREFDNRGGTPALESGRIYVSDPLGNLMMSYAPSADPKDLREDLHRLLRLSHIG